MNNCRCERTDQIATFASIKSMCVLTFQIKIKKKKSSRRKWNSKRFGTKLSRSFSDLSTKDVGNPMKLIDANASERRKLQRKNTTWNSFQFPDAKQKKFRFMFGFVRIFPLSSCFLFLCSLTVIRTLRFFFSLSLFSGTCAPVANKY